MGVRWVGKEGGWGERGGELTFGGGDAGDGDDVLGGGEELDLERACAQGDESAQGRKELVEQELLRVVEDDGGGADDPPHALAVSLLGEAAEERVLVGQHGRAGDDVAALDHGEELGHAVGHARGLEGEGKDGAVAGVTLGGGARRGAQGLVERLDGLDAVGQGVRGAVAAVDGQVGGAEAEHGVHQVVVLAAEVRQRYHLT